MFYLLPKGRLSRKRQKKNKCLHIWDGRYFILLCMEVCCWILALSTYTNYFIHAQRHLRVLQPPIVEPQQHGFWSPTNTLYQRILQFYDESISMFRVFLLRIPFPQRYYNWPANLM